MPESTFEFRRKTYTIKGPGPGFRRRLNGYLQQRYIDACSRSCVGLPPELASRIMRDAGVDAATGGADIGSEWGQKYIATEDANAVILWAAVSVAHPEFGLEDAKAAMEEIGEAVASALNTAFPRSAAPVGPTDAATTTDPSTR